MRHDDPRVENLLLQLFSYSPREGRSAVEDFCTECLAWVIRQCPDFRKEFLEKLGVNSATPDWRVSTQETFGNSRFDLVLETDVATDPVIVIECKVDAAASESQIKRYASNALEKWPGRTPQTVLLTKINRRAIKEGKHLLWREVHQICHRLGDSKGSHRQLVLKWFSDLLSEKNMIDKKLELPGRETPIKRWVELENILKEIIEDAVKAVLKGERISVSTKYMSEALWVGAELKTKPSSWVGFKFCEANGEQSLARWVEFETMASSMSPSLEKKLKNDGWNDDKSVADKVWWRKEERVEFEELSSVSENWMVSCLRQLQGV